jgi:hypothetical protein
MGRSLAHSRYTDHEVTMSRTTQAGCFYEFDRGNPFREISSTICQRGHAISRVRSGELYE